MSKETHLSTMLRLAGKHHQVELTPLDVETYVNTVVKRELDAYKRKQANIERSKAAVASGGRR